jgi:hypothetical protein
MRISSLVVLAVPVLGLAFALSFTPACGSGGASCANPTTDDTTCLACVNSSCGTFVSTQEEECSGFSCAAACNCGELSCQQACEPDAGPKSNCATALDAVVKCSTTMCASQCAGAQIY